MQACQISPKFGRVSVLKFDDDSAKLAHVKNLEMEDAARSLVHQTMDGKGMTADFFVYKGRTYFVEDTATDTDATDFRYKKETAAERGKSTSGVYAEYAKKAESAPRNVLVVNTGDAVEQGLIPENPVWTPGFLKNTIVILFKDTVIERQP